MMGRTFLRLGCLCGCVLASHALAREPPKPQAAANRPAPDPGAEHPHREVALQRAALPIQKPETAKELPALRLRMIKHGDGICVDVPTRDRKQIITVSLPAEVEELRLDPVIDAVLSAEPAPAFILIETQVAVSTSWWKEVEFRLMRKGYHRPYGFFLKEP